MKRITRKSPTIYPFRGKWRLAYPDGSGRVRTRTANTKQEAYRLLTRLGSESELKNPNDPQRDVPLLADWLEEWFLEHSSNLRPKTLSNNLCLARKHIIPELGSLPLNLLSTLRIEEFYRVLVEEKELAPSTVHRIHAVLSVPFRGAVRFGLLQNSPLDNAVKPVVRRERLKPLTREELQRVFSHLLVCAPEVRLRWTLALIYGVRQGETLGLTWGCVDLAHGVLHIDKQLQRLKGEGFVLASPKSTQGRRAIPIDEETVALFTAVHERSPSGQELVFVAPNGDPIHSSRDRREWKGILESAGVRYVSVHTARHTAATVMITSGVDVKTVQMVLGHSTPAFTLATYVHPSIDDLRKSLARIF